ncbi:hypothetical protein P5673_018489 [Acropora cervicornis]|uniref:Uncharacterized protein n=1 Tax=Acropora cervicornis TaxID=6130 RepID=A0AAD9QDG2_ACRCE|nr:hypothetical protein P5673_018489 [Acropora cervicornis]
MSECGTLNQCYIHVALMGSPYDSEVCGMKCTGREEHHIEIRVLQPTMSSTRMVVGDILSGNDPAFLSNVRRALEEALLAARAVCTQRLSSNFSPPPPQFPFLVMHPYPSNLECLIISKVRKSYS